MDKLRTEKVYQDSVGGGVRCRASYTYSFKRIANLLSLVVRGLGVLSLAYLVSGCAALANKEISAVEAKHGVSIDITAGGALADLAGGNSLVALRNVDRELENLPYEAKRGISIHIGSGLDLLAEAKTLDDVMSAPLTGAATQDRPGKTQGDVYVLNKDLWGTYMDVFQPGTTMWQDPHLRHEMMHAYEVKALKTTLFRGKWQEVLDKKLGKLDEMRHKLGYIDSVSLLARDAEIATVEFKPYVDFCARWMASMFGDVNADGAIDEADRRLLWARAERFDANEDGNIGYDDAVKITGIGYSFASGINPATQIEMTAGALGYRPKGFASPYGRTSPWEDKAEVLAYAIRNKLLPHLYKDGDPKAVAKAYQRLGKIRRDDPVFARKIEVLAMLFGSLEKGENRNSRFEERFAQSLPVGPMITTTGTTTTIVLR